MPNRLYRVASLLSFNALLKCIYAGRYFFFIIKIRAIFAWISHRKGSKNNALLKQQYADTSLFFICMFTPILFHKIAEFELVL